MRTVVLAVLAAACALAVVPDARSHRPLLAPAGTCAGDSRAGAPRAVQVRAVRCLLQHARRAAGRRKLAASPRLSRAATRKAAQIVACRQFSHTPCGRAFLSVYRSVGYGQGSWLVGEVIAWGSRSWGSPRRIVHGWLHSAPHKSTILRGEWRDFGVGRREVGYLFGRPRVAVWTASFGRP